MTRYAIDAPTLVQLAEGDVVVRAGDQLVAPNSIRSHALDLLLGRVRSQAIEEPEALRLHERMTEVKMRLLGDRVSRRTAWQIAMAHGLRSVELAEYLAVARLQADALVTSSPDLAALAAGDVRLASITDVVG